ncbi:MAG: TIGR02449 family protein [Gammaproteobacteria bacterium]|nr:TIGR02449 family protein [Gammaproteobacteria bacterium]
MDITVLEQFENHIDALLKDYARLRQENKHLQENYTRLLLDNTELQKKQMYLVERIEAIIQRLKEAKSD